MPANTKIFINLKYTIENTKLNVLSFYLFYRSHQHRQLLPKHALNHFGYSAQMNFSGQLQ